MSMLNLITDGLLSTQHIRHAAIYKRRDNSPKARTPGFSMSAEEAESIEQAFEHPKDAREVGITLSGTLYEPVRADDMSIYAKHQGGLIICKTDSYYVFGLYDNNMHPGVAVEAVEKLAEYLKSKGK